MKKLLFLLAFINCLHINASGCEVMMTREQQNILMEARKKAEKLVLGEEARMGAFGATRSDSYHSVKKIYMELIERFNLKEDKYMLARFMFSYGAVHDVDYIQQGQLLYE